MVININGLSIKTVFTLDCLLMKKLVLRQNKQLYIIFTEYTIGYFLPMLEE